ncbi:MAG: phosphoribosylglycinamide formyltransferase 2 [Candidatus Bathyarchaeia archaeon]
MALLMPFRDSIGTPLYEGCTKVLLLGAGELGKEIAIEAQRLGVETVTVDRYDNPPAAQVAHRHYTIDMRDGAALKAIARRERPDAIIPEVEAINTDALLELEEEGIFVVPRARATKITMDRIALRKLAAEEAGVPTTPYRFAGNPEELEEACEEIGFPCIVKARMSSGGLGSSVVFRREQAREAYEVAKRKARGYGGEVIVEGLCRFDFEITELALAHYDPNGRVRISFPKPVGHLRSGSHYHVSWQPFILIDEETGMSKSPLQVFGGPLHMSEDYTARELLWRSEHDGEALSAEAAREIEEQCYEIAGKVVGKLIGEGGAIEGLGIFGCELFVKIDEGGKPKVYFNEISPRPHDTGMVTIATQDLSEAALHIRAVLGLPISGIKVLTPGAAHVILSSEDSKWAPGYGNLSRALGIPGIRVLLFGKPSTYKERRLGLALAISDDILDARLKAMEAAHLIERGIRYGP